MDFRILGPLEVSSGGQTIDLGGPKQRALLAFLLLEANRVVSSDRLIDALWENGTPETAQKALQVYVSQLRKLLGRERVQTRAPGYLLRVEPGELDVERFEALHAEGRGREALALWRGSALADFSYQGFAQEEIARLEEARLACLEQRIDEDLADGQHNRLVGELEGLTRAHPHRERLHAQLMLALYRSGRQADALARYQAARSTLVEGLGIEPSRALRDLHQAILNQDPALDPSPDAGPPAGSPAADPMLAEAAAPSLLETRKTVTAVWVALDLSSRHGAAIDPEALRRLTGLAADDVKAAADRHGGTTVAQPSGSVTLVFGLPVVHEDDGLRALRAAAEMRRSLLERAAELAAEQAFELRFGIGISTGEVLAGGDAGGAATTGEPLTLSARLAGAGVPGEIAVDEATHGLVRHAVVAERDGGHWRVAELAEAARADRLASPMVGRERERRRLHDAFDQAVDDRSCQLFTVLGPAGVGKSRLVQEFLDDVGERALVARGRCLPYGEGITYWPLAEAVKEAVELEDSDSPEQARSKLAQALADAPGSGVVAERVAETIGLTEAAVAAEESFGAINAFFERLAAGQPLVLVFDDIHWAEPTFLDLVEYLADWTREAPILLVCLARPELIDLRPGWGGGKLNATSALLEPLSGRECARLIRNLLGQSEPAEEVEARIADAAEGNPLFVEEMLSMLIDDGLLVRQDGRWVTGGDMSSVRVPPTIQALLAARLDQLGADERAVLERAAVAGKIFPEAAVTALAPSPLQPEVTSSLGSLLRKELIRPAPPGLGGRTYRFRHLLIRDAAYDSIPKRARADLHERFGRWLDDAAGERSAEYEEIVGYHLEQAYHYRVELGLVDDEMRASARQGAELLGRAGRRALTRSDIPAGVNLVARAAGLLPPDDPLRVELIPNVRAVQGGSEDMAWADRVLTEAAGVAAATGDRRLGAHVLLQRGLLRLFTRSDVTPAELLVDADSAIAAFEDLGDELGLARAWRLKAQAHYLARQAGPCAEASEIAFAHARRTEDRFEQREILEWLVVALLLGPAPAEEATRICEGLLAEVSGDPLLELHLLGPLAPLSAMQGFHSEGSRYVLRCQQLAEESGEWTWIVRLWSAMASFWQDDPAEAERQLRPGYEALKRLGEKSHFSAFAHELAVFVYRQGRYEEAGRMAEESQDASRPNDVNAHIVASSTRAKVLAQAGDHEAAARLAREAVAFAAASDFIPAHASALMDLAEVLRLGGDPAAAAIAMEEAIPLYERKGNVVGTARARAALAG